MTNKIDRSLYHIAWVLYMNASFMAKYRKSQLDADPQDIIDAEMDLSDAISELTEFDVTYEEMMNAVKVHETRAEYKSWKMAYEDEFDGPNRTGRWLAEYIRRQNEKEFLPF